MPSVTVGTTAKALVADLTDPTATVKANKGIQIVADPGNTANEEVFVGLSTVTAGTNANTDGLPLAPGASYLVPPALVGVANLTANAVYVRATTASQKVYWVALN